MNLIELVLGRLSENESILFGCFLVTSPNIIAYLFFMLVREINGDWIKRMMKIMVCVSTGALLGDFLGNIIPECLYGLKTKEKEGELIWTIFVSILGLIIIDKCFKMMEGQQNIKMIVFLIADGLHNFTDGLAIGTILKKGVKVGAASCLSIFIHEVPHQLGDFSLSILRGNSLNKTLLLQLLTSIPTFLGGMVVFNVGSYFEERLNGIVIGCFVYLIFTNLVTEIIEYRSSLISIATEILSLYIGFSMVA